jgi:hypothetical protein
LRLHGIKFARNIFKGFTWDPTDVFILQAPPSEFIEGYCTPVATFVFAYRYTIWSGHAIRYMDDFATVVFYFLGRFQLPAFH